MRNNIGLFLTKRANLSPGLEAYVDGSGQARFTYAQLNARANRVANALLARGVAKGDRVALLLMNSVEYVETFFALAKIGAICVPLNWRLVPDELTFILRDAGATTLIFGHEFADAIRDIRARGGGEGGTAVETWIHVGPAEGTPERCLDYAVLQRAASEHEPSGDAADDDLLFIMYTSGTTGLPKGAVHTHGTATWAILTFNSTADLRYRDRYLLSLPLFHVGALAPLVAAVHRGVTCVVMRAFDPKRCWELVDQERITTMLKVPAMLTAMRQVYQPGAVEISQLRWCLSGAAPVPPALIEAYAELGIEIHQIYGMTECCGPACLISPDDALAHIGSTGKAFFHTDVRVVTDAGRDVAPGESGEVWIRGGHVMKEYWNRPDATAETIVDGWLRSGDGATMDADGFVTIQDRLKDMIISGGENVYPAEIESVLAQHPKIVEAGVIGQPSERWGESAAAIVVRSDVGLSESDVLDFCQGRLARFKQPRRVYFVDEIPRNPSGKILKRILREQFPDSAPE